MSLRGSVIRVISALAALLLAQPSAAAELSGVVEAMTNQLHARVASGAGMRPVTVLFKGRQARIRFEDDAGRAFELLLPESGVSWLVADDGAVQPLPQARWPLLFDPRRPCAGHGLFADCQPLPAQAVVGRATTGWRYRMPGATGPGATTRGVMWLDAQTGLVLKYRSEGGAGPPRQWQVQSLRQMPVPDSVFAPPGAAAGQAARAR